jgi:hypothetical protein
MSDVAEPKLNRQEELVREYILPLLPSDFEQPEDVGEEYIEITRSILAQQYVEHAKLDVLWKTTLMLLAYDVGFRLDSVVYGLIIGALGSLALALPNLYTPELLAEEAFQDPKNEKSEIEIKAERSVKTNVGVAGLVIGFIWQILSISGPIPPEIVFQNYLHGTVPGWIGFLAILFIGYLLLGNGSSGI